ncbi:TetR/AcrR family transcriptional regulator [Leptospira wolffii]|uniref:TetR family transcriptional regulator n=1 Tax=Leptospira wolffii TaxID=409998 RepID=A0A2M9Z7F0_9LEPT|nr:TetR/AcrR family transcriptional regulator [Leptospira wolffii]PJZ64314.1 TetR family transcriptional regulator [Leptospira wolffii]TGK58277.1 TetR/AcrR family transcriptional regulator [Leptospira wolffii]TGK66346.1 TetR/AcrR family transcriptional regulator [Leptospira wolffii]TGK68955.1 TetR/AcrR family transcriptional regulator [Leptospira wolffii]TGL27307.1 TetR/AcrR family transcriptional regulator [Leptospira wolffii]
MKVVKTKLGWKKMPEEVRRKSILKAAMHCFFSKGFERTSVQDIADAAGLTKGGIYFHFESKEEIRDTLIRNFLVWERFGFEDPEVKALSPHMRLVEYLERLAKRLAIEGNCSPRLFAEATASGGAIEREILAFYDSLERLFAQTIAEAQKNGNIKGTLSPELLARTLLALFDGLQIQSDISNARDQSKGREILKAFFKNVLFIPTENCPI